MRLPRLSGSGPATCRRSAGRSPLLQPVRAETGSHAGVEKPIATGLAASGGHWRVYAWGVRSRLGGDTSTGSDLTPQWLLTNLLRQNSYVWVREVWLAGSVLNPERPHTPWSAQYPGVIEHLVRGPSDFTLQCRHLTTLYVHLQMLGKFKQCAIHCYH